jgi:hypothetical protein
MTFRLRSRYPEYNEMVISRRFLKIHQIFMQLKLAGVKSQTNIAGRSISLGLII